MDVNLIHNGYSVQRRKMYPSNPRNNLISKVDLVWQKSLEKQQNYPGYQPKVKKHEQLQDVTLNYTKAIQNVMEKQARLDRSTFRVMPVHPQEQPKQNSKLADSLTNQLQTFQGRNASKTMHQNSRYQTQSIRNQIIDDLQNRRKPIQNSSNVSATVFGYNINYQTFKRQSYMSKIMSDRLQPYLSKTVEVKIPKKRSFQINGPLSLYYS